MGTRGSGFGVLLVLLTACIGGQGGDPGVAAGEDETRQGAGPVAVDFCQGQAWDSPDAPKRHAECQLALRRSEGDQHFECLCDGEPISLDAPQCYTALSDGCQVPFPPNYCELQTGVCFADAGAADSFRCRCSGDQGPLAPVVADSCAEAVAAHCHERCESDLGSCHSDGLTPGLYYCACTHEPPSVPLLNPDGTLPEASSRPAPDPADSAGQGAPTQPAPAGVPSGATCEATLRDLCGGQCETATGQCALQADHYACTCHEGTTMTLPLSELPLDEPSADLCYFAAAQGCGLEFALNATHCEVAGTQAQVTCEAQPQTFRPGEPQPQDATFECSCRRSGETTTSARTGRNCYRTAAAACPEAIEEADRLSASDFGTLCTDATQCSGGACYVPGTGEDSICSQSCESDSDCPGHSLCATVAGQGGRCLVRCDSDLQCQLLNDSLHNPLYCAEKADLEGRTQMANSEGGRVCVQVSEP